MYAPLHEAKKREWLDFHKLSSQGGFFFLKLTCEIHTQTLRL